MRYASRVDENQPEVVRAFRKLGCSVKHSHGMGQGYPDLTVGYGGLTALVEVKTGKGQLNARQQEWLLDWTGGHFVVRNDDDVTRIVDMLKRWHAAISKDSLSG